MDVTSFVVDLSVSLAQERVQQDVGIAVLRKERDARAAAATQLLEGLAAPVLPEHLGRNVNRRV